MKSQKDNAAAAGSVNQKLNILIPARELSLNDSNIYSHDNEDSSYAGILGKRSSNDTSVD